MSIPTEIKYLKLVSLKLRNFKQKSSDLWNFSCPFCGDSKKNAHKARFYVFPSGQDLIGKCHNCGISIGLGGILKHLDPAIHSDYLFERFGKKREVVFDTSTHIPSVRFGSSKRKTSFDHGILCSDLPEEHYCIQYIKSRKIPREYYQYLVFTENYKKFVLSIVPDCDKTIDEDARLVIPYYDEYKELIAVSGRALQLTSDRLRYVTIRTNQSTEKLVYGLDRLDLSKPVRIVEGPIDSLFVKNCIASGDASLSITASTIIAPVKILIWDNEPRNKEVCRMLGKAINQGNQVVIWTDNIGEKDINAMVMSGKTLDDIEQLISTNTFSGLEAQLRFNYWKKV